MAAVQRKLVHKQFNSPMGLYSQENVKATLDRELKAFGAEGIEVDEQITKPLNLANSAVLRAVEEEEQQVKCERQSRTRQRENGTHPHYHALHHQQLLEQIKTEYLNHQYDIAIDRDTVLRINRLATLRHLHKRDHSWPPSEATAPKPSIPDHGVHFDPLLIKQHSIEALREKFNSPTCIIEPTARQVREWRQQEAAASATGNPRSSQACYSPKSHNVVSLPTVGSQTAIAKGFSAPETKAADIDIGLVAPKCEYYEELAGKRVLYQPRRQAKSLDRGGKTHKCPQGAQLQLPPLKPRAVSSGGHTGSTHGKPKVQRRAIKLATEIKISYMDGEKPDPRAEVIDLELVPLPPTPDDRAPGATAATTDMATRDGSLPRKVIDGLAHKRQQQQLALAVAVTNAAAQPPATRIVPVAVEKSGRAQRDQGELSAQQIYDDACSYLRSADCQDHNQPDSMSSFSISKQPEEPPLFVSATTGIKLQRQASSGSKSRSQPNSPSIIPTPPPLPPPPLLRSKSTTSEGKTSRRQGVYFSNQSDNIKDVKQTIQHEANVEIAQLEAKYVHIQQSIAEHLRQIDAYMESAKAALQRSVKPEVVESDRHAQATPIPIPVQDTTRTADKDQWELFTARQSPILIVESPLQAILRHIYCKAAGQSPTAHADKEIAPEEQPSSVEENVPIVERALNELQSIVVVQTAPKAAEAQHVIIDDLAEEQPEPNYETTDYKHVADVISNYEHLAGGSHSTEATTDKKKRADSKLPPDDKQHKDDCTHHISADADADGEEGEGHVDGDRELTEDSCRFCSICGGKSRWGKHSPADQWRLENIDNEQLKTYESTYEIPSPYMSRQISWEGIQTATTTTGDEPQIDAPSTNQEPDCISSPHHQSAPPSPSPPVSVIADTVQRDAKLAYVSTQLEGHNVGLLVRTATQPLQLSMSTSSSMLAAAAGELSTPQRCNSQPPPFEFLTQHGIRDSCKLTATATTTTPTSTCRPNIEFKSLAKTSSSEEQLPREFSVNRTFDNVSPRPYIAIEGYKRVAWPPASEERIIREFTPQPQTQSPAPGAGGYYAPQSHAAAPQPSASSSSYEPPQGPIYNNVQTRPNPTHQQQQQPTTQHHPQQQQQQHVYGQPLATNYASNGCGQTPAHNQNHYPLQAHNQSNYPTEQQPIQYTQAQFNRQRSREPVVAQAPVPAPVAEPQYQPQQNYQPDNVVDNLGAGWKSIRPPQPKASNEYHLGGSTHNPGAAYAPHYQPQQQQHQQPPQQQQQYRAPSHDNYQQQQQYHQQQQQQQPPQQWQQPQQPYQAPYQQPPAQSWQQPAPQWSQQQHQQQPSYQTSPYQQQQQQQQQPPQPQYQQQNGGANFAQPQYNSYSQPQQPYSQDQTDRQPSVGQAAADYRGASPGIITLRKEAPVSQKPAPVYTSQPAAVSFNGGSKLRGDLKWPPPEYKEAAARENEERRQLALGPVCRPRRVNRDYTPFFAKHQLNCTYPSYKVPPGTQHMLA